MANSSVLIAIGSIARTEILLRRFPQGVLVPRAVWHEVVETGAGMPGAQAIASAPWIDVRDVDQCPLLSLLRSQLDDGEAEAITLACQIKAPTVLLDEKDARRVARGLGLDILGTVGLLLWAKRANLIASLKGELEQLTGPGRFRLSAALINEALRLAGEE